MSGRWKEALAALDTRSGPAFWRGLDELVSTETFRRSLTSEFPALSSLDLGRRDVLRAVGASLVFAGLGACEAEPDGRAVPFVEDPEHLLPGQSQLYATGVPFGGIVQPVLGVTTAGRPIKLEGNPDHPASRGATDAFTQASLLDVYDPERSQAPRHRGQTVSWSDLDTALAGQTSRFAARSGAGFRILTGASSSPTLQRQWRELLARWPQARVHSFEPVDDSGRHAATEMAFGRPLDVTPLLDRAEAVVLIDADPLGPGPTQVRDSLAWAARRRGFQRGEGDAAWMVAEPSPTLSGGRSLDRLVVSPSRAALLVEALAGVFGVASIAAALTKAEGQWIERAARLLAAHRGRGLLLVGGEQPPATQALAWAIDEKLGNLGATTRLSPLLRPSPAPDQSLAALISGMERGEVEAVAVIDCNPVYAAQAGERFGAALRQLPFTLHAGAWHDETADACQWHAAMAHPLEGWSDGRAADGTAVIIQPLVRPFYDVRSLHRLVAALGGDFAASDHALVQQTWAQTWGALHPQWETSLLNGIAPEPPATPIPATAVRTAASPPARPVPKSGYALLVRPDPTVWDGRLANNPWAQENPKPVTTLTWDNAVLIAPAVAARLGLEDGDDVRVRAQGASVVGPVWVMPGQDETTVLVHRGYGRRFGGVARNAGFDVAPLVGSAFVTLEPTGARRDLACAQPDHNIDGTDLVRVVPTPGTRASKAPPAPNFYPPQPLKRPSWGMSIDLDLCTGCGACVTACVAENNVPMVGREEVRKGRRMHWLRVDRYYEGDPRAPALHVQPVPCMHCEDAPCEMGCPVNAAVHSPEGLNLQVYNRCIGTRTCSSFCPYKVRRFNWYDYHEGESEPQAAQHNPNVTVRARGVMEKCTYCIQRISAARIAAKEAGRPIPDGAVKTACQQVCPTGAISFGDIADPASDISRKRTSPRDYALLEEANTRPRTRYRARIRSEGEGGRG